MGLVVWLRRRSGELYFLLYNAAIVFILPYFAIMWHDQGLTGGEIGILSAIRPFTCSISGQLLVGLADARCWHFAIALTTYVVTLAARSSMALVSGFTANLVLILISEACQSPFSIMSDAAIAASTDEAGYGRKRVLASLGWGALAPLSGWVVGKYGVPVSIAIYFAIVTVALVPTALLPLRELGCRTGRSSADEVPAAAGKLSPGKAAAVALGKCSASVPLLPGGSPSSHDAAAGLDTRQHNGHAAELAIELLGAVRAQPEGGQGAAAAAARAAQSVSSDLVGRLSSKLSQASHAGRQGGFEAPTVSLPPLLTTADEDAAEQEVATARAEAAESAAAIAAASLPPAGDGGWTIPAISPLRIQCSALPPIACPHVAAPGAATAISPHPGSYGTPASFGAAAGGPLARTSSAATTAFYSVRSDSSMSNLHSLPSPRTGGSGWGEGPALGPRSALLSQLSGATLAGGSLYTPRTAASAAAAVANGQPPLPALPPGGLFRQTSEAASLAASTSYLTPRTACSATGAALPCAQPASLARQPSNLSQRLQGFSVPEGFPASPPAPPLTLPALAAQQQAAAAPLQQAALTTQLSNLSQTLHGFDMDAMLELEESPGAAGSDIKAELAAALASSPAAADHSHLGAGVSRADMEAGPAAAAGSSGGGAPQSLSVWGGIKRLLSNPHHAAFFGTTLLCGIGYGALGYENLYLKESGAPGILLGVCQLASTCGEVPLFATSSWWLPKLGHELAFSIGMIGWIARLSLYTLLPLFPSPWCVLPVELLQGFTFAVSYGVGTVHAKAIAPPRLRSTTQSIFFGLYYGVGPGISGLAGGYIYQALGMRYVFIITASTLAVGWLCILLALRCATRAERAARAAAAELAP